MKTSSTFRATVIAAGVAMLAAFAAADAHAGKTGWKKGKYLPDIVYVKNGERTSVHAQRGKPTFVLFWASWCPNCAKEWPHIQDAYNEFGAGGEVEFILLNMFEAHVDGVDFVAKHGYTAVISDPLYSGDASKKTRYKKSLSTAAGKVIDYKPKWIPRSFVLDAAGKIVVRFTGNSKPGEVKKAIVKAMQS